MLSFLKNVILIHFVVLPRQICNRREMWVILTQRVSENSKSTFGAIFPNDRHSAFYSTLEWFMSHRLSHYNLGPCNFPLRLSFKKHIQ
jgi:hypothetical protein